MIPPRGRTRLFAFDFDGTLSPIVPIRSAARIHPACRRLLGTLASLPRLRVAVLSSRALEDLVPRVPVRGLLLGGGSGLEWRLPGGGTVPPPQADRERLERVRREVLPELSRIARIPGVELEDKRWSAAVHYRHADPAEVARVAALLEVISRRPGIGVFPGPRVLEVQFLPGWSKARGLARLFRLAGVPPRAALYAGDDSNDAFAMRWLIARGGLAVAAGPAIRIPGVPCADGPAALARMLRSRLPGAAPEDTEGRTG